MVPNSAQPFASPLSLLLEQRLSPERLSTYVVACTGRLDDALVLYQWNTAVTGAFWEDMAHLEVLLRNAIDDRLTVRHADRGRTGTWLDDPARELTKYAREDITRAKERLRSKRKQFSRGQVVSELSFGFWRFLLSKRHTNLWPDVATGFPHAPNQPWPPSRRPWVACMTSATGSRTISGCGPNRCRLDTGSCSPSSVTSAPTRATGCSCTVGCPQSLRLDHDPTGRDRGQARASACEDRARCSTRSCLSAAGAPVCAR